MAYRVFHDAYAERLSRYLLVVARGDETAVRDALQEAFTRVVRHVRVFSDETVFWSWLTVLARSAFRDGRRRRSRYGAFLERFARLRPSPHEANQGDRDDDTVLVRLLERELVQLPSDERDLLERKYRRRCATREIAEGLGTTEKAVESRLARIRLKLKHAVLAALKDEPDAS